MNSRIKGFSLGFYDQKIPKKTYITKTAYLTSNALSFDKFRSKEQGDAEKILKIDDFDDIIKKYNVYFQNEPTTYEGSKVEKVRAVHRSVSTESKASSSVSKDRRRKLKIEIKNPLINEKILKYRDLKHNSKSCNPVASPALNSDSASDSATDKQGNNINRCSYRFITKSNVDASTSKTSPGDYHVKSQISFCKKQSIPSYSTLYDDDYKRKSLLRTIRLQRLLNRLITLKARQKKKLNWINFIKEFKIKHKLMREQNCVDKENERQSILKDSYCSNSNTDVTLPYRTNTTANISNLHYKTNTISKINNPLLRNKTIEFRNPHKTNTTTDISNFYRKYNIADTCKFETPITKRGNNRSKFTTQMIDDFFNPEPRIERSGLQKFTGQDAFLKFEKVKRAEENEKVYSTSSSNLSPATKKARKRVDLREKYNKDFIPKPLSSFSKSERKSLTTIQRSYSFTRASLAHDGENLICTTSTQTESLLKFISEENKGSHKSVKIKPSKVSKTDGISQKLESQCLMEAKIDSLLQSVNSLLTEIRIHKSKIIVAEKEASLHNNNIQEKQSNLNENKKNCKRRYVLNEYFDELDFDRHQIRGNKQESGKYKGYPVSFTLYKKDKCIEVSKSLANSFNGAKSSKDDDSTDNVPVQDNRLTPINNNNKNFLTLVKTILPSPYEAIKKIISYVPSINYYNYLALLPTPVTLMSKCLSNKYLCNICGARFETAAYLSHHIELNHLSKIRDSCVCRHIIEIDKRKPGVFRCRYCSQIFTRSYCCELHQQSCAERMGFQHDERPSLLYLR